MVRNVLVLLLLLILCSGTNLFSQELSQQVLVPVAGVSSTASINYSQTIGETAVEIISCPEYTFTQGFQQPIMTFLPGIVPAGNGVEAYPNPATDIVTIKLFGQEPRDFRIDVLNIAGTIVYTENVCFTDKYYLEKAIPVSQLYKGIYFVKVFSKDGVISRTFKIEKM
jgi:Secretion system C-terminal sorting domain